MSKKQGLTANGEAGRAFRAALRSVPYCPITGNQPTRMTKASFLARCAREQARDPYSYSLAQYCGECRGKKVPAEIEFIELEELKGGEMERQTAAKPSEKPAKRAEKVEKCQSCGGEKKQLRPASGIRACPSCSVIISAAKNRPEMVLAQLERLGKLPSSLTVASCEQCSSFNELENLRHGLSIENKELHSKIAAAERDLDKALGDLHHERNLNGQLAAKIDQMIDAELYGRAQHLPITVEQSAPGRDSMMLDLYHDVLTGKVTGLDADRLLAMRGVV